MTPEDIKNIRYKWFHFKTVPKDIVERVFTALESAWADLELRDVALLKIRKAMGLERDSEEDLVDRAQALLLLIEQAEAKRDELIYNLTLEELKHDKTRQLSEVHLNDRIRAIADAKAAFDLSKELRCRAIKAERECATLKEKERRVGP
jgi:hypothetical protein